MASHSRRDFLKTSGVAASGLVIGMYLPVRGPRGTTLAAAEPFAPNAFVRITSDDVVTVIVNKSEMGQGVFTSLPMILAEELDADWGRVRVQSAPATPEYGFQVTGGSTSVRTSWEPLRQAGAMARALLVEAASKRWGVDAEALRTEAGHVVDDANGRSASYGELAAAAATLPAPENVRLKDPKDFKIVGTNVKRVEGEAKVTGKSEFSLDLRLPDMRTAVVAHPPVLGGKMKSFRAEKALAVPGVLEVKPISTGVAVIADGFWSALNGRRALEIEWDPGVHAGLSTSELRTRYRELSTEPGGVAEDTGDVESTLGSAARTVDAVYEVPYLAHAPMEPLNAVAHVRGDGCDIWAGTQFQTGDQLAASQITGLRQDQIHIHTTMLGGGFGRRATPGSDFVSEAVEVAKGQGVPVKTVWTREDDIQGGYYRPMFVHRLRAGIDAGGKPLVWHQRLVGQSIAQGTPFESEMMRDGIDEASVEGAAHMPYAIPHRHVELHNAERVLPVLWWRSVGHTHTGFVNECFLDEVAHAGGQDPYELRRELLADQPRYLAVLDLAAERAGWGEPLPEGRARGIALRKSFESYCAQVAEVSVEANEVRVHKVVCALDCGIAVNPWNVVAQMESGIVYGLTAALYGEITLAGGRVEQSNFHDYEVLRMDRMPEVEVHLVESTEPPTGVGEPGVPPIAPAVANAVFALTGRRIRKLPIRIEEAEAV